MKLTPGRPEWVEQLFARRFFSVSRVLEALVAGTSRMHWGTFVFYSVLGGTIWATAVVLAGYWDYYAQGWGNTQPWSRLSPPFLSYCSGRRRAPSSPTGVRPPAGVDRLS